jgi:hypothetical protein
MTLHVQAASIAPRTDVGRTAVLVLESFANPPE